MIALLELAIFIVILIVFVLIAIYVFFTMSKIGKPKEDDDGPIKKL